MNKNGIKDPGAFEILRRFGSVAIALICVQVDYFALALALPGMAVDLKTSTTDLQWTMSAYMIAIGIVMVPGSRIADLLGRKKMLLIGLAIFGLSSLWIGLSNSAESVIIARLVQGIGAGLYFPVSMSLVSNATTAVERSKVLGFLTGVAGVGIAAGPVLGGGLTSTIGWRWVFFINVPIALMGVIWGILQLREQTDTKLVSKRILDLDWIGIVLIAVGIGGISLGIDNILTKGFLVPIIIGVIALIIFIAWERRASWALVPPVLWKNTSFSALVVGATVANMGICAMIFGSTIYLQQICKYSGLVAGLMFIPAAIGLAVSGPLSGRLASRVPGKRVMTVAMLTSALSLCALAFVTHIVIFLVVMAISSFLLGIGIRFGVIAVQSVVKQSEAGAAAGVILTLMVSLGGIAVVIASAIIEVVGSRFPAQSPTTVVFFSWGVLIFVLGSIFGMTQWRGDKVHVADSESVEMSDDAII